MKLNQQQLNDKRDNGDTNAVRFVLNGNRTIVRILIWNGDVKLTQLGVLASQSFEDCKDADAFKAQQAKITHAAQLEDFIESSARSNGVYAPDDGKGALRYAIIQEIDKVLDTLSGGSGAATTITIG